MFGRDGDKGSQPNKTNSAPPITSDAFVVSFVASETRQQTVLSISTKGIGTQGHS